MEGKIDSFISRHILKKDTLVIIVLSLILSILTFYSVSSGFYDLERGNNFASSVGKLLSIPYLIFVIPFYYLSSIGSSGDMEGLALGAGILGTFLSPVLAFIFWFIIFWLISKLAKKFSGPEINFLWKHIISIAIVLAIVSPYLNYKTGTNEADMCLSGALNSEMMSGYVPGVTTPQPFIVGPEDCLDNILDEMVYIEKPSSKKILSYCMSLSDTKIVWGTEIPYQDYCVRALGFKLSPKYELAQDFHREYLHDLLPPTSGELSNNENNSRWWATYETKLCQIFGSLSNSEEKTNDCLAYYINYTVKTYKPMTEVYCKAITSKDLPTRCTSSDGVKDDIPNNATMKSVGKVFQVAVAGPLNSDANLLQFDYSFDNITGSIGLLTVYWSDKPIGTLDSRSNRSGLASFPAPIGESYKDKSFTLVFRLDSFTNVPSSLSISNPWLSLSETTGSTSLSPKKVEEIAPDRFMPYQPAGQTPVGTIKIK